MWKTTRNREQGSLFQVTFSQAKRNIVTDKRDYVSIKRGFHNFFRVTTPINCKPVTKYHEIKNVSGYKSLKK